MEKIYLSHMSWFEVKEAVKKNPVILIPVGSTETQNLHNPTGYDYLIAQRLAEESAKKSNALVSPVLPFGYSEIFKKFPGTITLRPETLSMVFEDIADSLIRTGFDHLLFINNHEPNHAPLGYALDRIREKFGIVCSSIWPTTLARDFAQDLFEKPEEVLTHGNEPSTSLLKYLYPQLIRLDLIKFCSKPDKLQNFDLASALAFNHQGQRVPVFLQMSDVSKQGGWGKIEGSAEKGKIMFERMINFITSFIKKYRDFNTTIDK